MQKDVKLSQPLAIRLALYTILIGIVIGSFIALLEIRADYERTTQDVLETAEQMVELTLQAAKESVFELNTTLANNLLSGLMQNELFLFAGIYDELGQPLAVQSRERQSFSALTGLISLEPIELDYSLDFEDGSSGAGQLKVTLDVQAGLANFYAQSILTTAFQLLEAIGLSFLIFIIVAVTITSPVSTLAEQIADIEPGSGDRLELRDGDKNRNEISRLISSANKYLDATTEVQKDLAESRELLREILNNLHEGIVLADAKGLVVELNPAARSMFLNSAGLTDKTDVLSLVSSDEFTCYNDFLSFVGDNRVTELTLPASNNALIPVELSLVEIDFNGEPHTLWTFRDVSERNKADQERSDLESQLNHSQKMEALGTLAGGIAHDFNNILGGISGYTEMAIQETSDPSVVPYLENVLKGSDKASQLVNRVLAFSHKHGEDRKPTDLSHILHECIELMRQTIPTTIKLESPNFNDVFAIMADETMMHQVLMNLISNASSAIGTQVGEISCDLENCKFSEDQVRTELGLSLGEPVASTNFVKLSIKDSGPGIPVENIHRIFEPYFTTKQVGTGTGLGLAITHSLVKKHGGFIRVDSASSGTVFDVYLPLLAGEYDLQPLDDASQASVAKGCERILIVEDNEMLADMLTQYLGNLGYDAIAVGNGVDGLNVFESTERPFDLIITDQTMPKMNGDTLIKKVLAIRPNQKVILCTGYSDSVDTKLAQSIGVKHFLMKPVSVIELGGIVRSVLDH